MHDNFSDDPNNLKRFLQAADNEFTKYSEVLAMMQNCSLCGSTLDFAYTIEHPGEIIREEVSCPHCEIRIRNKLFNIQ
jgi:C4-type Zn-finger protein